VSGDGRHTICVDFDGVLNAYTGWRGPDTFEGAIPGAIEWLKAMLPAYKVVILTTRGSYPDSPIWVRRWLIDQGLSVEEAASVRVTCEKPPALIYLDDRGVRFTGSNYPSVTDIRGLRPWWRKG
jgi:hypothetical protein